MGMGRKRRRQESLWVATQELLRTKGHVFYERVNRILEEDGFDPFVEGACQKFYAAVMGRPGVVPGMYFRMLLVGYFEGIDSERGIAWRCADSLSLREFLGVGLTDGKPGPFERIADAPADRSGNARLGFSTGCWNGWPGTG